MTQNPWGPESQLISLWGGVRWCVGISGALPTWTSRFTVDTGSLAKLTTRHPQAVVCMHCLICRNLVGGLAHVEQRSW